MPTVLTSAPKKGLFRALRKVVFVAAILVALITCGFTVWFAKHGVFKSASTYEGWKTKIASMGLETSHSAYWSSVAIPPEKNGYELLAQNVDTVAKYHDLSFSTTKRHRLVIRELPNLRKLMRYKRSQSPNHGTDKEDPRLNSSKLTRCTAALIETANDAAIKGQTETAIELYTAVARIRKLAFDDYPTAIGQSLSLAHVRSLLSFIAPGLAKAKEREKIARAIVPEFSVFLQTPDVKAWYASELRTMFNNTELFALPAKDWIEFSRPPYSGDLPMLNIPIVKRATSADILRSFVAGHKIVDKKAPTVKDFLDAVDIVRSELKNGCTLTRPFKLSMAPTLGGSRFTAYQATIAKQLSVAPFATP